jgi:Protein of unknown function (DUF3102)
MDVCDPIVNRSKSELAKLAGEISWYEEEARKTVMLALQYKLEIGRRLARAKTLLPHGRFLVWAHDQFGWTPRHVQRHLTLAENAPRVACMPHETSLRMALAAIRELRTDANARDAVPEAEPECQSIHIIGELQPGTIDQDLLLAEVTKLAGALGVQKLRWKIR